MERNLGRIGGGSVINFSRYEQILKETERELTLGDMLKFLYRYGYFSQILDLSFSDVVQQIRSGMPEFREAIRQFQDFYRLTVDGDPGPETQRAMLIPRCGCPDVFPASKEEFAEVKNYQGKGRWPIEKMDGVGYFIESNVPNKDAVIEGANRWNAVCGIDLRQVKSKSEANIVITHKRIDSAGGTLALGWFPMANSPTQQVEQRLDSSENWTFNFLAEVSCHESGHNMGWDHKSGESVMHPYATGQWPKPTAYDISVARDYYGEPVVTTPDPAPPTPPSEPTDNPFSRIELRIPHPDTGTLTDCFVAPKTNFGGL